MIYLDSFRSIFILIIWLIYKRMDRDHKKTPAKSAKSTKNKGKSRKIIYGVQRDIGDDSLSRVGWTKRPLSARGAGGVQRNMWTTSDNSAVQRALNAGLITRDEVKKYKDSLDTMRGDMFDALDDINSDSDLSFGELKLGGTRRRKSRKSRKSHRPKKSRRSRRSRRSRK
jgi:hypothetical protein